MIGNPTAWLTAAGTLVVIGGFVWLGDKLGQEIRAFRAERAGDEVKDPEPTSDWPADLHGDVVELPHDARRSGR